MPEDAAGRRKTSAFFTGCAVRRALVWRWTHEELERVFRENGDWSGVTVTPGSGSAACLGMLIAYYADLLVKRAHVRPLGVPIVVGVNLASRGLDRLVPGLREPQPDAIFANYSVVAEP